METDPILKIAKEFAAKVLAAEQKYTPILRTLNDADFAGLWRAILVERENRLLKLVLTNPLVQQEILNEEHQRHVAENN